MDFAQPPFALLDRVAVAAALAHVGHEVLGRGDHTPFLAGPDEGRPQRRAEDWVFAVALLRAAPAAVRGEVHHWGEQLAHTHGTALTGDHLRHLAQ